MEQGCSPYRFSREFVSVIIPTYRDWHRLRYCLKALANQSYPSNRFEVIVVNNDLNDLCPYKMPAINMQIINESKKSSYAARNAGIHVSHGDIIAFTDSDCIPHKDWLKEGIRCIKHEAKQVGGQIVFSFNNSRSAAEILDASSHMDNERTIAKHSCAVTANLFVDKKVFDAVGVFNPNVISGGDIEFTQRAHKMGFSISYCEKAIVEHPTRTLHEQMKKAWRVGKGTMNVEMKRPAGVLKRLTMIVLHMVPLINPSKIMKSTKQYSSPSGLLLLRTMMLSVLVGVIKTMGVITSIIVYLFKIEK